MFDVGLVVLNANQQVDFATERAHALLGVTSDAEFAQRWRHVERRLGNAFTPPGTTAGEPVETTIFLADDPSRRALRVRIYDIAEEGCVGHLVLLQHGERAAASEAALRHAARNRGRVSLVRDLAHDLKGLLNVIAMNVEILSRLSSAQSEPRDRSAIAVRSADAVRRELRRLDRSIEVILNRDATGHETPQRIDVRLVCQQLADLVAARAQRQHVTLTLQLGTQPAEIIGFPDRVHAALLSLIVNALDAMPGGGTLRIDVACGSSVRISVCDTGTGIDAALMERMWRLHYTTKPGGTGIGLTVARMVAESHGGRVSYDPNPEGGACFVLDLPSALDDVDQSSS